MRKSKKIVINKFNNYEEDSLFYNYYPKKRLKNSLGVGICTVPEDEGQSGEEFALDVKAMNGAKAIGITSIRQYFDHTGNTRHRLLVYGDDGKTYIHQLMDGDHELYWMYGLDFNGPPIALQYKKNDLDTVLLASSDKMMIWETNYQPYEVKDTPIVTSMCYGDDGILYCTIVNPAFKLWYCTNMTLKNIGNISASSNYISLEDELGYARKVINFDENIYVFRDYGITKLSRVGTKFTTTPIYSSSTLIYANTISVCGNEVLFMTSEGLYSFNGVKISKCNIELSNMLSNLGGNEVSSSLGDKYYLALRLDFNDDKQVLCEKGAYINNAILIVDIRDFSYQIIRGVDVRSLYALKTDKFEKMLMTFNSGYDVVGQMVDEAICMDNSLPKYWCSGQLAEGLNTKLLTKLSVVADNGVKFNLIHDGKSLSFTTYQDGYNEFSFKILANLVRVEISSEEYSAEVEEINLDYYEY